MIREDATRSALWAVFTAFVVFFACVFAFLLLPGRSIVAVLLLGSLAGLFIAGAFRLFMELFSDKLPPV